jgi:transcriptional regulator with XRE-family HTH domain
MIMKHIANSIKLRRKELKITQTQLAAIAGISVNTIYKLERNQSNPSIEIIEKLLDTLGLTINIVTKNN